MKIAIADDEEILLAYLKSILCELLPSAQIDAFRNASSLLEKAESTTYDIAFLDIRMPETNGITIAERLIEKSNSINIIFVTGFDGYQDKAMDLFASGYVKKPVTKEKLLAQLRHLRYPVRENRRVYAQTFGNFTLFVDGKPVHFARSKSQAALAYLIHRRGSLVNKKELSAAVFDDGIYDANRMSYISKMCADITSSLESVGVTDMLQISTGALAVNCNTFDCDVYDFLDGKADAISKFVGEYMSQYSFGEEMLYVLNHMISKPSAIS